MQSLRYINQGRGGTILYTDNLGDIQLDFEFGAGNCVAIIFIPSQESWVHFYKRTPETRWPVVNFVAGQAVKDQTSGGYYELYDQYIEIYSGR